MPTIRFNLNHQAVSLNVDAERTLLWVLRTDLGLTGAKYGCGAGLCGACTVLINEEAVQACQTAIKDVAGADVITIEGLAENGKLHPIQQAFVQHDALQCGFCTPGMILKAYGFLVQNPHPTEDEIIVAMDDNLCRCGSHVRVIRAVLTAASRMKGGQPG